MIESTHSILNSTTSKNALKHYGYGAPGEIRTPDLMVRSHALYPTELRAHTVERPAILTCGSLFLLWINGGEGGIRTLDGAINPILP